MADGLVSLRADRYHHEDGARLNESLPRVHDVGVAHLVPEGALANEGADDGGLAHHVDDQEAVEEGEGDQELVETLGGLHVAEDDDGEDVAAEAKQAWREREEGESIYNPRKTIESFIIHVLLYNVRVIINRPANVIQMEPGRQIALVR